MKSLKDYTHENINESLSSFLKGFWSWLFKRKKDDDEDGIYDASSEEYDKREKINYVNSHHSFIVKEIKNMTLLNKIIENSKYDSENSFKKINDELSKNGFRLGIKSNKAVAIIFYTKKFTETCALFLIQTLDTKTNIFTFELLPIYKYSIKFNTILKMFKSIIVENDWNRTIVSSDESLNDMIKENKIDFTQKDYGEIEFKI